MLFPGISKQWISCPEQQKTATKYMFAVVHQAVCETKKPETVNTASVSVTSLLITLLAPDDPANSEKVFVYMYTFICLQGLNIFLDFV